MKPNASFQNMTRAANNAAIVDRDYFPAGALKAETQRVAVLETPTDLRDSPFINHRYRLGFTYDLSGRRLTRRDSIPGGCVGCVQAYHYEQLTGALEHTTDAGAGYASAQFGFQYDSASRIRSRTVSQLLESTTICM